MPRPDMEAAPQVLDELTEAAYAKVNLALHVRARRADGYHELESLFVFAEDGDELTGSVSADGGITLDLAGEFGGALDAGPNNIVMKAALALRDHLSEKRGVRLRLVKNLPVASGIGGGSADAAATLRLLVRLWDVRIAAEELEAIALALGSDVPACLASVTQIVRGRGEILKAHNVPGLAGRPMLLVNPGVAVSTAQVFARWDGMDRGALIAQEFGGLIDMGRNDLENAAIATAPVIADVIGRLKYLAGAQLVRMSGSGATCFALFDDGDAMAAAAAELRNEKRDWWMMETRVRGG